MAVRNFDGANDTVTVATGAANPTGEVVFWALVRRNGTGWHSIYAGHNSGGTYQWELGFVGAGTHLNKTIWYDNARGVGSVGNVISNTTTWHWVVFTKPSGAGFGRWHTKPLGGAWTHTNGAVFDSGSLLNVPSISGGTIRFGEAGGGDDLNARLAHCGLAGGSGANLDDASVEGLFDGLVAADLTAFANAFAVKGVWNFNQAATTDDVLDLTGGGANETSVAGTSVITTDDPPGFAFDAAVGEVTRTAQEGASVAGVSQQYQRGSFTAEGRQWVFLSDNPEPGTIYYSSSADGGDTWAAPTSVRTMLSTFNQRGAAYFDIHFDGTYIHYVAGHADIGEDLVYRRGTPGSGGTITWSAAEQIVASGDYLLEPSITTDSDGYPWVSYEYNNDFAGGYPRPMVTKSSTQDGTWTTDTGFPFRLTFSTAQWWTWIGRLDESGGMIATYWTNEGSNLGWALYSRIWNGSAWEDEQIIDIDFPKDDNSLVEDVAFATDPFNQRAYAVWSRQGYGDTYLYVLDGGVFGIWTGEANTSGHVPSTSTLAVDDDGVLHHYYVQTQVDAAEIWHNSYEYGFGLGWGVPDLVTTADSAVVEAALQVSERNYDGELVLLYQRSVASAEDAIHAVVVPMPLSGGGSTREEETWSSSYDVLERITTTWSSSYDVLATTREEETWSSSYDVLERVQADWSSSYDVLERVQTDWSSSYDVLERVQTDWSSSYAVESDTPLVNALYFDGSDDVVQFAPPPYFAAPFSWFAVVKREVVGAWHGVFSIGSFPNVVFEFDDSLLSGRVELVNNPSHMYSDSEEYATTNCIIIGVTRDASMGFPTFHKFENGVWTHEVSTVSAGGEGDPADWTSDPTATLRFGNWDGSFNYFQGWQFVQAAWLSEALTNTEIEELAAGTKESWSNVGGGPDHLWELNTNDTITDFIGSLDETSRVGAQVDLVPLPDEIYSFGDGTTRVETTWSSSYDVLERVQTDWSSSYNVLERVQTDWSSSYDVLERVQTDWSSSYTIAGRITSTWSSSYDVLDRQQTAWSSSYIVRERLSETWSSSYGVAERLGITWSSSYVVDAEFEPIDAPSIKMPTTVAVTANVKAVAIIGPAYTVAITARSLTAVIESDNTKTVEVTGNLGAVEITPNSATVAVTPNTATVEVG